jgi:hypothetical protein
MDSLLFAMVFRNVPSLGGGQSMARLVFKR